MLVCGEGRGGGFTSELGGGDGGGVWETACTLESLHEISEGMDVV